MRWKLMMRQHFADLGDMCWAVGRLQEANSMRAKGRGAWGRRANLVPQPADIHSSALCIQLQRQDCKMVSSCDSSIGKSQAH